MEEHLFTTDDEALISNIQKSNMKWGKKNKFSLGDDLAILGMLVRKLSLRGKWNEVLKHLHNKHIRKICTQ